MKISSFMNLLARSFVVFILSYLWIGYYVRAIWAVFLLSTAITAGVNVLFWWLGKKKNGRAAVSREKREHIERVTLQLRFSSINQTLELFKRAFNHPAPQNEVKKFAKKLGFTTPESAAGGGVNFFSLFHKDVTTADIIACVNATAAGAATWVAAESFSPTVAAFARGLEHPLRLIDNEAAYEILEKSQTFPELTVAVAKKKRITLRELSALVFARVKFKNYVIMGTIILFTSFIVRFNIYYIIVATFVFGLALASLLYKPRKV